MIVNVYVTAKDIAEGIPCSCAACPVARAMSRAMGEEWHVGVGANLWRSGQASYNRDRHPTIETIQKVADFIYDFDTGGTAKPIRFKVEI